jgi:hypothetical protein
LLAKGILHRSSQLAFAGCAVLTLICWFLISKSVLSEYRMPVCSHLLWGAAVVLGLTFRDEFATLLSRAGALAIPLASAVALTSPVASGIPTLWKFAYIATLGLIALVIGLVWHRQWYLYAFSGQLAIGGYGAATLGFRSAEAWLGQAAVTAFAWSAGSLLLAVLISAHKARWLPPRFFPKWRSDATFPSETPMEQGTVLPDATENG